MNWHIFLLRRSASHLQDHNRSDCGTIRTWEAEHLCGSSAGSHPSCLRPGAWPPLEELCWNLSRSWLSRHFQHWWRHLPPAPFSVCFTNEEWTLKTIIEVNIYIVWYPLHILVLCINCVRALSSQRLVTTCIIYIPTLSPLCLIMDNGVHPGRIRSIRYSLTVRTNPKVQIRQEGSKIPKILNFTQE